MRKYVARTGLLAKGVFYLLTGSVTFLAAFAIGGQTTRNTGRSGVFKVLLEQPAGKLLIAVLAAGLLSYSLWRYMQSFKDTERKGKSLNGLASRVRYFFSGLTYSAIAILGFKIVLTASAKSGNSNREMVHQLLIHPYGKIIVLLWTLILAAVGIYQISYGLSEKFRKHTNTQQLPEKVTRTLIRAGIIGYVARGIVWILLAFLFGRAGLHERSNEAGDTSDAFSLLRGLPQGQYLLAAMALGLICYSVLNFFRVAYSKIN